MIVGRTYIRDAFSTPEKNLNLSISGKLFSSTKTLTSKTEIVSLINQLVTAGNYEALAEIYNLIMLVDESTKSRYQGQKNVKYFQDNLTATIQTLLPESTVATCKALASEFMTLGTHKNERMDDFFAKNFSCKFNTGRVKSIKAFIKNKIPEKTKTETKFKQGYEVRNQFYFLIDSYIPKTETDTEMKKSICNDLEELTFLKNTQIKNDLPTTNTRNFLEEIIPLAINGLPEIQNKVTHIRIANLYRKIISLCEHEMGLLDEFKEFIQIMKNIIQNNPCSLKHAAEHKIIILKSYLSILNKKGQVLDLKKRNSTKELIRAEIKKQEEVAETYGSYSIERMKDFTISPAIEASLLNCFVNYSRGYLKHQKKLAEGRVTSRVLLKKEGENGAVDGTFYVPIYHPDGTLVSHVELKRSSDSMFTRVSSSKGRDHKSVKKSIVNPMNVETSVRKIREHETTPISKLFQCGACENEHDAKQRLVKMFLDNKDQILSKDFILIVDATLLKNGYVGGLIDKFGGNEINLLTKHREFIHAQVKILNGFFGIENFESRKTAIEGWLKDVRMKLTEDQKTLLYNNSRPLKCYLPNFSAFGTPHETTNVRGAFAGLVDTETRQCLNSFILDLESYQKNKSETDTQLNENLRNLDLKSKDDQYLVGDKSLSTATLMNSLLNSVNGAMKIACRSHKDRGTKATEEVLYQDALAEYLKLADQKWLNPNNVDRKSLANWFKSSQSLREEKKRIYRLIYYQGMSYSPTIANTGWAGNRSDTKFSKNRREEAGFQSRYPGDLNRYAAFAEV